MNANSPTWASTNDDAATTGQGRPNTLAATPVPMSLTPTTTTQKNRMTGHRSTIVCGSSNMPIEAKKIAANSTWNGRMFLAARS